MILRSNKKLYRRDVLGKDRGRGELRQIILKVREREEVRRRKLGIFTLPTAKTKLRLASFEKKIESRCKVAAVDTTTSRRRVLAEKLSGTGDSGENCVEGEDPETR